MPITDHLSLEQEGELFSSPDARDARRQTQLSALAINFWDKPRGKRRPTLVEAPTSKPDRMPNHSIVQLGKLLKLEKTPVLDKITEFPTPTPRTWDAVERYIMGANTRVIEKGENVEERRAIRSGLRRQTQHVADKVQRDFRTGWQIARLRRAALSSVQDSVRNNSPILTEASLIASDAIEDLGVTLRDHPVTKKMPETTNMPIALEHLGVYAVDDPEVLREQPLVLRLVQIEQAKREEFWGEYYYLTLENDRDRRTVADKEQDQAIGDLIGRFTTHAETA